MDLNPGRMPKNLGSMIFRTVLGLLMAAALAWRGLRAANGGSDAPWDNKTSGALVGINNIVNPSVVVDLPLDEVKQRLEAHLEILSGCFLLPIKGPIQWISVKPGSSGDKTERGVHVQRHVVARLFLDAMPDKVKDVIPPKNAPYRDEMQVARCRVDISIEEQKGRSFVEITRFWNYRMRNTLGRTGIPLRGYGVGGGNDPQNVREIDPDFQLVRVVVQGVKFCMIDADDYMRRHVDPDWIEKVPLETQ